LSIQLLQVTVTEVRTLQLSAMPQPVVFTLPVSISDTTHDPELGGEFTLMLTEAVALLSLSTVAVKT